MSGNINKKCIIYKIVYKSSVIFTEMFHLF